MFFRMPKGADAIIDPRDRYARLNAFRGFAVLFIVVHHIAARWIGLVREGIAEPLTVPFLNLDALNYLVFGGLHVSVLFMLSGYLLSGAEERRLKRGQYSLRAYALRRFWRLVPAYYAAIALAFFVWPGNPTMGDVLLHVGFLYPLFEPFDATALDPAWWSLTSEAIFYCLLPLVVLKVPGQRIRLAILGLLVIIAVLLRALIVPGVDDPASLDVGINLWYLAFLPSHLAAFAAGVALRAPIERLGPRPLTATVLFFVSASFLVLYPYLGISDLETLSGPWGMLVELAMYAFLASILLGALSGVPGAIPLAFVGRMSYSLFLLHQTVIGFGIVLFIDWGGLSALESVLGLGWGAFFAYALVVLVVASPISYLSYRCFEVPFLRLKPK